MRPARRIQTGQQCPEAGMTRPRYTHTANRVRVPGKQVWQEIGEDSKPTAM